MAARCQVKCHTKQLQLQWSCYGLASGWEKCLQACRANMWLFSVYCHTFMSTVTQASVLCVKGYHINCLVSYPVTVIHTMLGLHQSIFTQWLSSQTGKSWNFSRVPTTREFPYWLTDFIIYMNNYQIEQFRNVITSYTPEIAPWHQKTILLTCTSIYMLLALLTSWYARNVVSSLSSAD